MTNVSQLPIQTDQSGSLPAVSKSNPPLCVTDPARALERLGQALVAVHPNGKESYHKHDFDTALKRIASEIFGVDSLPSNNRAFQKYMRNHSIDNLTTEPERGCQVETLMYALDTLVHIQRQAPLHFGPYPGHPHLLSWLLQINCAICAQTGDTNGIMRVLNDPEISVSERIKLVANDSALRKLSQARGNDGYTVAHQKTLYEASWRLCKQIKELICKGGEDGQTVPKEHFKEGIRFLLDQGKAGHEMIYHDSGPIGILAESESLRALTFESMADVYQLSSSSALSQPDQLPDFPVNKHTAFMVFEALNVEGSTCKAMDIREQAFNLLTAPLRGFPRNLVVIGSTPLPDDQDKLLRDLRSLILDLPKIQAEFTPGEPEAERLVEIRLKQLERHLEERPAIGELKERHLLAYRVEFDYHVRDTLAGVVRAEMPDTARMRIVEVTARIMDQYVEHIDQKKPGLISRENKKNILNIRQHARKELEHAAKKNTAH